MAALPNTMAATQGQAPPAPEPWVNPYDSVVNEYIKRMNQPQAPLYSPEEVQQRRQQNEMEQQLGVLGAMSGHAPLQAAGGQVLKQAIAASTPHVSERGIADPLSGSFRYSPEYLRERDEAGLTALQGRQAAAAQQHTEADLTRHQMAELARERMENAKTMRQLALGGGGVGTGASAQIGSDPTTQAPVFRNNKTGALFTYDPEGRAQPYKATVAPKVNAPKDPTEDMSKAAGWFKQAHLAFDTMNDVVGKNPGAAAQPAKEIALSMLPLVGDKLAFAAMSPARQRFTTAASSFSEAVLRAATGAGVNRDEALQKVNELTPRWGESAASIADKKTRMATYLDSLQVRAGRALTPKAGATADADPLNMRGGQ